MKEAASSLANALTDALGSSFLECFSGGSAMPQLHRLYNAIYRWEDSVPIKKPPARLKDNIDISLGFRLDRLRVEIGSYSLDGDHADKISRLQFNPINTEVPWKTKP